MPHTFSNLLTHVVFSTQDRQPFLTLDLKPDLLAYMGRIIRKLRRGLFSISPPSLIRRRLLHMINHEDLDGALCRLQFQPKLLLKCSEN
jgi:hypothetical protein